jgi:hypothetical protein
MYGVSILSIINHPNYYATKVNSKEVLLYINESTLCLAYLYWQ